MTKTNLLFVELMLADGNPFDGLVAGTFTDMFGREITITPEDLETIAANTARAIETSRTESGELIGLPIDARDHDKGDAAGWIVGATLVNGIIQLVPKWTEIGMELISKGIRRLFSATVDMAGKYIAGGTLTNWPAVRGEDGRTLLRPIELSLNQLVQEESMKDKDKEKDTDLDLEQPDQPDAADEEEGDAPQDEGTAYLARLREMRNEIETGLRAELEAHYQSLIQGIRVENTMAEFQRRIEGGDVDCPRGLPVDSDALVGILKKLDTDARAELMGMFDTILDKGLVQFEEVGHSRRLQGKPKLDAPVAAQLRRVLDAGGTVEAFFERAADILGSPDEYNLSEFTQKG